MTHTMSEDEAVEIMKQFLFDDWSPIRARNAYRALQARQPDVDTEQWLMDALAEQQAENEDMLADLIKAKEAFNKIKNGDGDGVSYSPYVIAREMIALLSKYTSVGGE